MTKPQDRPEFSRPEKVDAIGAAERTVEIAADAAERAALARRFDLLGIDRLEARFAVRRDAAGVSARGRVVADVVQPCSVTGGPVPARVDEEAALLFVPAGAEPAGDVELDADALDQIPYEGGAVDLGEAAAETMALALDPFPRAPDAADALRAAGVLREEEARPLSGLAALKDKLAGR